MDGSTIQWKSDCVGELVWVSEPDLAWIPGSIISFAEDAITVKLESNGALMNVPIKNKCASGQQKLLPRDMQHTTSVENMDDLRFLNEASVLHNVQSRFDEGLIYTKTGPILIAMNPFQWMPELYSDDRVRWFHGRDGESGPPHCFAEVQGALSRLRTEHKCQSLIICGESGAGKTETTKLMLQYLSRIDDMTYETDASTAGEKIMETNPLMEAFGNAKTIRNGNSSRFGKFILVHYKHCTKGVLPKPGLLRITGARILNFLLEKSRIVGHAQHERNFHIFYQVLAASSKNGKYFLSNKSVSDFHYLCPTEDNDNCAASANDLERTRLAMKVMGMNVEESESVIRVVAAVLHLGNIKVIEGAAETSKIADGTAQISLANASQLLMVNKDSLGKAITQHQISDARTGGILETNLNVTQATDARDAIAKAVYFRMFSWLVDRVNLSIGHDIHDSELTIGFLDIYGFENLQINSFEQLLINYANETLQCIFNQEVFLREEEEYKAEGILWNPTELPDNQPCLDLIGKPVKSIFALIDEEGLRKAVGNDKTLARKIHHSLGTSRFLCNPTRNRKSISEVDFGIVHYAGLVEYTCDGFVSKNRDTLSTHIEQVMQQSVCPLIKSIFSARTASRVSTRPTSSGSALQRTLVSQFRDQLKELSHLVNSTQPRFIRCIKSNSSQEAFVMDLPSCLVQLRNAGVMAALEMRRSGFPNREKFSSFLRDHKPLIPLRLQASAQNSMEKGLKEVVRQVLAGVPELDPSWAVLGTTKVFFRSDASHVLQGVVAKRTLQYRVKLQSFGRCILARVAYVRFKYAVSRLQAQHRGIITRTVWELKMKEVTMNRAKRKVEIGLNSVSDAMIHVSELISKSSLASKTKDKLRSRVSLVKSDYHASVAVLKSLGTKVVEQNTLDEMQQTAIQLKDRLEQLESDTQSAIQKALNIAAEQRDIRMKLETAKQELAGIQEYMRTNLAEYPEANITEGEFEGLTLNNTKMQINSPTRPESRIASLQSAILCKLHNVALMVQTAQQVRQQEEQDISNVLDATKVQEACNAILQLKTDKDELQLVCDHAKQSSIEMQASVSELQRKLQKLEAETVANGTANIKEVFDVLELADTTIQQFRISAGVVGSDPERTTQLQDTATNAVEDAIRMAQQATVWLEEQTKKTNLLQTQLNNLEQQLEETVLKMQQQRRVNYEWESKVKTIRRDIEVAKDLSQTTGPLSPFEPLVMNLSSLGLNVPNSPRRTSKSGLLSGTQLVDLVHNIEKEVSQLEDDLYLQEQLVLEAEEVYKVARAKVEPVYNQFTQMLQTLRESDEYLQVATSPSINHELQLVQDMYQVLSELIPGMQLSLDDQHPNPVSELSGVQEDVVLSRNGVSSILPAVVEALQKIDGARIRVQQHLQRHRLFQSEHQRLSNQLETIATEYGSLAGRISTSTTTRNTAATWWGPLLGKLRNAKVGIDQACAKLQPPKNARTHNTESLYAAQTSVNRARDLVKECTMEYSIACREEDRVAASIKRSQEEAMSGRYELKKAQTMWEIIQHDSTREEMRAILKEFRSTKNCLRQLERINKFGVSGKTTSSKPTWDTDDDSDDECSWIVRRACKANVTHSSSLEMNTGFAPLVEESCNALKAALYSLRLALQTLQRTKAEQHQLARLTEEAARQQHNDEIEAALVQAQKESVKRASLQAELRSANAILNQIVVDHSVLMREQDSTVQDQSVDLRPLFKLAQLSDQLLHNSDIPLAQAKSSIDSLKEQIARSQSNVTELREMEERRKVEQCANSESQSHFNKLKGKYRVLSATAKSHWKLLVAEPMTSSIVDVSLQSTRMHLRQQVRVVGEQFDRVESKAVPTTADLKDLEQVVVSLEHTIDSYSEEINELVRVDNTYQMARVQIEQARGNLSVAKAEVNVLIGAFETHSVSSSLNIISTTTRIRLLSALDCATRRANFFDVHLEHQVDQMVWVENARMFDAAVQLLVDRLEAAKNEVQQQSNAKLGHTEGNEMKLRSKEKSKLYQQLESNVTNTVHHQRKRNNNNLIKVPKPHLAFAVSEKHSITAKTLRKEDETQMNSKTCIKKPQTSNKEKNTLQLSWRALTIADLETEGETKFQ